MKKPSSLKELYVSEDKIKCAMCGHIFFRGDIFSIVCDFCLIDIDAVKPFNPWSTRLRSCICCENKDLLNESPRPH